MSYQRDEKCQVSLILFIINDNVPELYHIELPLLAQSRLSDLIAFGLCKLSVGKGVSANHDRLADYPPFLCLLFHPLTSQVK